MKKVKIKMQSDIAKVKNFAFWVVILIFEFRYCPDFVPTLSGGNRHLGFGAWDLGFCSTPDKSGNYRILRREGILSFVLSKAKDLRRKRAYEMLPYVLFVIASPSLLVILSRRRRISPPLRVNSARQSPAPSGLLRLTKVSLAMTKEVVIASTWKVRGNPRS